MGRAFFSVAGAAFVAFGVAISGDKPIAGVVTAAAGVFLVLKCGSRRAVIAQLAARYGRSRFITDPATYQVTSTGVRSTSETSETWWSWRRVAEVRDHEDGLLIVFEGQSWLIDLPPSAFVTVDRSSVARYITESIAAASTASPAAAS